MPLKCLPLDSTEFDIMVPALWEAFETPLEPFLYITAYLKGPTPQDRKESIETSATQLLALHSTNPNSHFIKVIDTDTGKLVGATNWILNQSNPFTEPQEPPVAVWWPEGEGRRYASNYLQQIEAHKSRLFNRPHAYLNISFTIPQYRRRGVGNLMIAWGVQKADEMKIGSFVEATKDGKFLYEKFGFLHFDTIVVNTKVENPSEEWKRLEKTIPPSEQYIMWRPIGGIFEAGKTTLPWETKPFVPIS